MLKNIDPLLVPALLTALAEMGHGDVLAVVDRNFPAHSCGRRVVELPGADVTEVLRAVLTLLPIDTFQDPAAWHMLQDDGDDGPAAAGVRAVLDGALLDGAVHDGTVHDSAVYGGTVHDGTVHDSAVYDGAEHRSVGFAGVERHNFYDLARAAYCTVRTADARPYACFLVAKGVVA